MQADHHTKPTRIWILRHGQSELNQAQCFQGCGAQSSLTAHGIRSARSAAERLIAEEIDAIYSSPLDRAMETAEQVQQVLETQGIYPELHVESALREIELPGWEGLSYAAVREQHAESLRQFHISPASFTLRSPDGSQLWPTLDLELRVHLLMPRMLAQHPGRNILLVTHGGPARILLLAALGLPLDHFHSLQQSHGGLSCISASAWPDALKLEFLNETCHTGESLPKLKQGKTGIRLLVTANHSSIDGRRGATVELAQFIESLAVHRILAAGQEGVFAAMHLLRHNGRATIEKCSETDICSILDSYLTRCRPNELVNLVLLGRHDMLAAMLTRMMQPGRRESSMNLELQSGLTVLHLPGTTQLPILQAVNTHQARLTLAGGRA